MASKKENKQDTSRTARMTATKKKKRKINVSIIIMLMPCTNKCQKDHHAAQKIYAPMMPKKNT